MKSHDRRIVAAVLVASYLGNSLCLHPLRLAQFVTVTVSQAMTLLALLLGLMAFLLGRGVLRARFSDCCQSSVIKLLCQGVEDGVSKARENCSDDVSVTASLLRDVRSAFFKRHFEGHKMA